MININELQNFNINIDIAKEAFSQSEKRLNDILETKKQYEQKAFILLNSYFLTSTALFTIAFSIFKSKESLIFYGFIIYGIILFIATFCFILSLLKDDYGYLGSTPDMWLKKDILEGDNSSLAIMLSYITYYHQERINYSLISNQKKEKWIDRGIYLTLCSPIIFFIIITLFYLFLHYH
jgi:hypothetical protein